ncbi:MAG: hypothetical protein D3910_20455 [Candidatus Electrothrix sp. ATG2]|nr:hypothetical protein [Candidatus Electrothrix sp. ATG2]
MWHCAHGKSSLVTDRNSLTFLENVIFTGSEKIAWRYLDVFFAAVNLLGGQDKKTTDVFFDGGQTLN